MKELSIEEKAKAYDERLAKARKEYSIHEANNAIGIMDALERVFPELKESEDERIRKALIEEFLGWSKDSGFGRTVKVSREDILAWLEKQGGEQNLTLPKWKYKKDNTPLSRDSIILNKYGCVAKSPSGALVSDVWVFDYDELAKLPKEKYEKQREQSTNHKTMIVGFKCKKDWHGIGDYCCGKIYNGYPCEKEQKGYDIYDDNHIPTFCDEDFIDEYFIIIEEKQGEKSTDKEMKEALRTEYEKGRADAIAEMQKLAWSEEDERHFSWLIEHLGQSAGLYDNLIDWLKFLKDRYTWKPSDEQINALEYYIYSTSPTATITKGTIYGNLMVELLEQLKKLREE